MCEILTLFFAPSVLPPLTQSCEVYKIQFSSLSEGVISAKEGTGCYPLAVVHSSENSVLVSPHVDSF